MNFPKITIPQIIAFVAAVAGPICVLLGVDLSPAQKDALDTILVAAGFLFGADAVVRVARNYNDAKKTAAKYASQASLYPALPDEGDAASRPE